MPGKLLILFLFAVTVSAQDKIDRLRNEICEINISFLHSKSPGENKFIGLENLLNSFYADEESKFETSEIITEFEIFLDSLNQVENVDLLKKVFRTVNNKFNALSYKYFYEKAVNSSKQKILVFSTSMSCECTLEMCYQQEAEVQKFCKENNYDYAVIDSWEDFEIQQKYKVSFVPTAIFLDSNNTEIKRFTRVENLYPQLSSLVN
jgi:hypothetical protein